MVYSIISRKEMWMLLLFPAIKKLIDEKFIKFQLRGFHTICVPKLNDAYYVDEFLNSTLATKECFWKVNKRPNNRWF